MSNTVLMPKLGNSVESCIVVAWHKQVGDEVVMGEPLCEVETDKSTMQVESTATGTLLQILCAVGDDVPVMTAMAVIGKNVLQPQVVLHNAQAERPLAAISPRARKLAQTMGVDVANLVGTGPNQRIIERDVKAAMLNQSNYPDVPVIATPSLMTKMTPLAQAMVQSGDYVVPTQGSGMGGKITKRDLNPAAAPPDTPLPAFKEVEIVPLKGVRKIIAERMLQSLQSTAQLTLHASADARALQSYRQRLKASPEALAMNHITLNDLMLFAVSRVLLQHPEMNRLFIGDALHQYHQVHLAFAVDTPRGLFVPVIRNANTLSLKQVAHEAKRLAAACVAGHVIPDELNGGTFTVSNLGGLGIESFTPVLNLPQVAILGVGNITLRPLEIHGEVKHFPHIALSLTINHQVVDGAPGARFLQSLAQAISNIDVFVGM